MKPTSDNPHAWTAFCYAAGELTADEQASFEQTLAEDQQAREALAEAVALAQAAAVALAPAASKRTTPVRTGRPHRRTARWYVWMSLGAAACLVLMAAWRQIQQPAEPGGNTSPSVADADDDPQQQALAARWNQVRQQDNLIDPFDADDWSLDDEMSEPAEEPLAASAPAWMLAAASQLKARDMTDDGMNEPEMNVEPPQEQ